jgi:hypothetical protein
MLKLNCSFTKDEQANAIIRQFINDRITELAIRDIEEASGKDYLEVTREDKEFQDNIHYFFPDYYTPVRSAREFLELLKLLKSRDQEVPTLTQEYALHAIIERYLTMCDNRHQSPAKALPAKARSYVQEVLRREYEASGNKDELDPDYILGKIEDMYDYDEICTFNLDYSALDHFTEDEINDMRGKEDV